MKNVYCILFLLIFNLLFSQNEIKQLEFLYSEYRRTCDNQPDSALYYISYANKVADKIKDDNWLAITNFGIGYCHYVKQENPLSVFYTEKAITYAKKSKNDSILSKSYTQKGLIYLLKNEYKEALNSLHQSLNISEKRGEFIDNTISALTYIGDIYRIEKDTLGALKYYHKAKFLGENIQSKRLDNLYNNLGVLYMGSHKDSALFYFRKALNVLEKNNRLYGIAHVRINIAATIFNFSSKENYQIAFEHLKKAEKLAEELNNTDALFFSTYFLGIYYEKAERDVAKAISYYEKSLKLTKEGYRNEYIVQLYESLSRASVKLGNYKKAYEFQKIFHQFQDSVFSVEKNKQFHEVQTKFEVEQKNNRINLLNKENEIQSKQKLWIFITASILVFSLIIIAYVYKKDANSQKVIRKQDQALFAKEKESIEHEQKLNEIKFLIAGQNQERTRISKELHDGIGSSVAAIKMNLSVLNEKEIKNKRLNYHIERLTDVSKEIRIISHAMSISIDSGKSLVGLINDLIEIYQFNKKLEMQLTLFPEDCLDNLNEFEKINLYRIFQEAFANIFKHSRASKVNINCIRHDDHLTIMIEDNGIGFSFEDHLGMGIKNIRERIKELKGTVHIDSAENQGTTITLHLPQKIENEN